MEKQKVTIVMIGAMGYHVIEASAIEHGRKQWAQYPNAPWMKWIPKGARKLRGVIEGNAPFFVILKGWGLKVPECQQWIEQPQTNPAFSVREGKYSMFDERWRVEMNAAVDQAIAAGAEILADYRCPIRQDLIERALTRAGR